MKRMNKIILMIVAVAALTACNGNKFHVDGTIDGASDTTLVLEQSSNGEWYIIDSVKVDGNGHFSASAEAPEVPASISCVWAAKPFASPSTALTNSPSTPRCPTSPVTTPSAAARMPSR